MSTKFNHEASSTTEALGLPEGTKPVDVITNRIVGILSGKTEQGILTEEERLCILLECLDKIPVGAVLAYTNRFNKTSEMIEFLNEKMGDDDVDIIFQMIAKPITDMLFERVEEIGVENLLKEALESQN